MAGRLNGKAAVVTGGCSGIGLATVRRLSEEGARVVIADIDDERGHQLVAEVSGRYVNTDVTNEREVKDLYASTRAEYGSVDVAFHNAGISPEDDGSILDVRLDTWHRVQQVNLTSVYLCCQAVLPYMLEQGRGSIINNASVVALLGAPDQISYSASKGGVLALSREIAVQFARHGVRVNALCPGPVNTPLLEAYVAEDPRHAARRLERIPMGRFGDPREVANAVLFLASDESSYVTGTAFMVDGGTSGAFVGPE